MTMIDHFKFLRDLQSSGYSFNVIFDIGANIGVWSREVQKIFPNARFEMFEPLIGQNQETTASAVFGQIPNSRLHSVALSDKNSTAKFKILDRLGVGSSLLVLESDHKKDIKIISCDTARLDDFVEINRLPQPDFMKLDTQGSELKILKGSVETLKNTSFLLVETWARRGYGPETPLFHELSDWLYGQGFILFDMLSLDDGRESNGEIRWFDALFIRKDLSISPKWSH